MNQLDISQVPAEQRLEKLSSAFDALDESAELVVSCDASFLGLLREFQQKYWGKYDWLPLISGPSAWKGKIFKRKASGIASETIYNFMERDHARCDQLYADGEAAILDNNMALGKELLASFDLCMRRHFAMEELFFFPAFEERTGMTQGPTSVMRMEHEQMRQVLGQMKTALAVDDSETVLGAGETILILLQQHNTKEENMLYPMGDGHISDIAEAMLKKMQLIDVEQL